MLHQTEETHTSTHKSSLASCTRRWSDRLDVAFRYGVLSLALLVLAACGGGSQSPSTVLIPTTTVLSTTTTTMQHSAVTYLHVFGIDPSDGAQPTGPLLQASDGNFYGTTASGGAYICSGLYDMPCGTIFMLKPNGETSVLYSFGGSANDGSWPTAPLIQGKDGAIYGMTTIGGRYGAGTVFKITLDGVYTALHSFGESAADGVVPVGGLVQAADGYFYGATASGGANHCIQIPSDNGNCGTIFRMSSTGDTTIVYSFGASPSDGVTPNGTLLQGSDGNLYGTTLNGGGTVFKVTPGGVLTTLHSFGTSFSDGAAPQGPLIQGSDGAFYGITVAGGGYGEWCYQAYGCGTVFKLTSDGSVTILYSFGAGSKLDGTGPAPYLIQARDGNFYGTTRSGGANGGSSTNGTAFRLTPSGVITTLYSFGPSDTNPSHPAGGLIEGRDGAFYGSTFYNGRLGASGARFGSGTLFKLVIN